MNEELNIMQNKSIVLIDGVCHLCQGLIRFIIPRDPKAKFLFAPLQSEIAAKLMSEASTSTWAVEHCCIAGERCVLYRVGCCTADCA